MEFSRQASSFLSDRGVPRGATRAVAHVGVELLLDAAFAGDSGANEAYLSAVSCASSERVRSAIHWQTSDAGERFQHLCHSLRQRGRFQSDPPSELVAERLRNILADRPRLAMDERGLSVVRDWVTSARSQITSGAPLLLREVEQRLHPRPLAPSPPSLRKKEYSCASRKRASCSACFHCQHWPRLKSNNPVLMRTTRRSSNRIWSCNGTSMRRAPMPASVPAFAQPFRFWTTARSRKSTTTWASASAWTGPTPASARTVRLLSERRLLRQRLQPPTSGTIPVGRAVELLPFAQGQRLRRGRPSAAAPPLRQRLRQQLRQQ